MPSLYEMLGQTWPARMAKSAWEAAKLPGDVYAGKVDPLSDEGIGRAADLGGMVMGGTFAGAPAGAMGAGIVKPIRAYHGSPHDFDRFDLSKIGTGEGAQAYGHGLYFAENPATAQAYRDALEGKHLIQANDANSWALGMLKQHGNNADRAIADIRGRLAKAEDADSLAHSPQMAEKLRTAIGLIENEGIKRGKMYEVNINAAPEQFLDWDKPLAGQSKDVQSALKDLVEADAAHRAKYNLYGPGKTGAEAYESANLVPGGYRDRPAASSALLERGIPGIKYLDQGSRGAKEGTSNYVLFRDDIIDIVKKYGLAGAAAMYGISQDEAKAALNRDYEGDKGDRPPKPDTRIGRKTYADEE